MYVHSNLSGLATTSSDRLRVRLLHNPRCVAVDEHAATDQHGAGRLLILLARPRPTNLRPQNIQTSDMPPRDLLAISLKSMWWVSRIRHFSSKTTVSDTEPQNRPTSSSCCTAAISLKSQTRGTPDLSLAGGLHSGSCVKIWSSRCSSRFGSQYLQPQADIHKPHAKSFQISQKRSCMLSRGSSTRQSWNATTTHRRSGCDVRYIGIHPFSVCSHSAFSATPRTFEPSAMPAPTSSPVHPQAMPQRDIPGVKLRGWLGVAGPGA